MKDLFYLFIANLSANHDDIFLKRLFGNEICV